MKPEQLSWISTFPELKTRPELVEELLVNRRLRSKLFHAFNVLGHIANCPDVNVATECLQIMSDYHWNKLRGFFKEELEAKNPILYNYLVSTFRNFTLNMQHRITGKKSKVKNVHYVSRAA